MAHVLVGEIIDHHNNSMVPVLGGGLIDQWNNKMVHVLEKR